MTEQKDHLEKLPEIITELNGVGIPGMTATPIERARSHSS
jgi:hypothetical protein